MLEAVQHKEYTLSFFHVSPKLKADKDFILDAVQQNGSALRYASDELISDREVVLAAVNQNADAIYYASHILQERYNRNKDLPLIVSMLSGDFIEIENWYEIENGDQDLLNVIKKTIREQKKIFKIKK